MPIFGHVGGLPVEEVLMLVGPAATTGLMLCSIWLARTRRTLARRTRRRAPRGSA